MHTVVTYLHVAPEGQLPEIAMGASKMIVVVDAAVSNEWQTAVSDWIVASGCLYMMAWGIDCSSWDDSVDWAILDRHDFGEIPDDKFVMTSWHERDSLDEVFWNAKNCARHPAVVLAQTYLLHISTQDKREELLRRYAAA